MKNAVLPKNQEGEVQKDVEEIAKKVIKEDLYAWECDERRQQILLKWIHKNVPKHYCVFQITYVKIYQLDKEKGKVLHKANKVINEKKPSAVKSLFANIYGDLQVCLVEPCNETQIHMFFSLKELDSFLLDIKSWIVFLKFLWIT